VKRIFADTLYWVALFNERDQHHTSAVALSQALSGVQFITTDEVLGEFLTFFAGYGPRTRESAADFVEEIMTSSEAVVIPQSHETFVAGLLLYRSRLDKGYSLADCVSMTTMRQQAITEILTHDHHFRQEGFRVLMRP